jgi:hypothetical protein
VTLPVSGKIDALAALHRKRGNAVHLIAIRGDHSKHVAYRRRPRFNGLCPPSPIRASRKSSSVKCGPRAFVGSCSTTGDYKCAHHVEISVLMSHCLESVRAGIFAS